MTASIWRYLINPFEVHTKNSNVKMLSLATDTHAKLNNEKADPDINVLFAAFDPIYDAYRKICIQYDVADGNYKGKTLALQVIIKKLPIELRKWESEIRTTYVEDSPEERALFPEKRTPFLKGRYEDRISTVGTLMKNLSNDPQLAAAHTQVQTYYNAALNARLVQQEAEGDLGKLADQRENQRIIIAEELYGILGKLMHKFRNDRVQSERFFDLSLLRQKKKKEDINSF